MRLLAQYYTSLFRATYTLPQPAKALRITSCLEALEHYGPGDYKAVGRRRQSKSAGNLGAVCKLPSAR